MRVSRLAAGIAEEEEVTDAPLKATILAVDDDPQTLVLVRHHLRQTPFTLEMAADGNEALIKIAQLNPDLVILDVNMPGRNGFEVCRFLRSLEETRHIPVLMLTALSEVSDKVKGLESGANEFLTKPVDGIELQTRVTAMLRAKFAQQEIVEKNALLEKILGHWHGPEVIARIKNDAGLLNLGGEHKHVTVLFADLCGFTRYSETVSPEEVMATLNDAFGRLARLVGQHGGTFDKYVGDCLMAFYGAPITFGEDAVNAVRTAVQMQAEFREIKAQWAGTPRADLGLAIGLNSGQAVVGNIGSEQLMGYTVIGDTVNVASRIQGCAEDGQILMGEATYSLVSRVAVARAWGETSLKGRQHPVSIFELVRLFRPI